MQPYTFTGGGGGTGAPRTALWAEWTAPAAAFVALDLSEFKM